MIAYINQSTDPYYNLALEEYFLTNENIQEDILLFWRNHNTIVIGKNQNVYAEINQPFVKENDIQVVRRLSGGGAVYHDDGNLNYTIIKQNADKYKNDFSYFTTPVVKALQSLGLPASFSGRNDILLDDKKISGNAQYNYKNRQLNHGTLLFDSNLNILSNALLPNPAKYITKGVKSVKSRVTNIKEYDKTLTIDIFINTLLTHFFPEGNPAFYPIQADEINEIQKLRDEKYATWAWVYGRSPAMDITKTKKFDAGIIDLHYSVKKGVITEFLITGDFFEVKPVDELSNLIVNTPYNFEDLQNKLTHHPVETYIFNGSNDEFLELLFN